MGRINNKCLIVGYGSAGSRHAENAESLGCSVSLVTSQSLKRYKCYQNIRDAIKQEQPRFVVIASPTYRHIEELKQCMESGVSCLIEKPLAMNFSELETSIDMDSIRDQNHKVAYCLRYHPIIKKLKQEVSSLGKLGVAHIVFEQYLPWWRPNSDYRKCYSASPQKGGGVLLDSSHEIDLLTYLFGPVDKLVAVSEKVSSLEIESDDLCMVICKMTSGQIVQIALNYINQIPQREIIIDGAKGSIKVGLLNNRWESHILDVSTNNIYELDRNSLFIDELDDFINKPKQSLLPNLEESKVTLKIIDAIRKSAREEKWINL